MRVVWAVAANDLRRLLRQPMALFWVLGYPVLVGVLFGLVFSGVGKPRGKLPLIVVVNDASENAQELLSLLQQEPSLEVTAQDLPQAQEAVRRGKAVAYLLVKRGFGQARLFAPQEQPLLELGVDPSRGAEAGLVEAVVTKTYFSALGKQMMKPENLAQSAAQLKSLLPEVPAPLYKPLEELGEALKSLQEAVASREDLGLASSNPFNQPVVSRVAVAGKRPRPANAFAITMPQASVWALVSVVMSFSLSLVRERSGGTWLRLLLAPTTPLAVMAGKALACFLAVLGSLGFLWAAGWVLGAKPQPVLLWLGAVVCAGFCFSGITMLLATLGKSEEETSGWGWAVMLLLAMLGGGMIPLALMPRWMSVVSQLSPVRWVVYALEGATWRGLGWKDLWTVGALLIACGLVSLLGASQRLGRANPVT